MLFVVCFQSTHLISPILCLEMSSGVAPQLAKCECVWLLNLLLMTFMRTQMGTKVNMPYTNNKVSEEIEEWI